MMNNNSKCVSNVESEIVYRRSDIDSTARGENPAIAKPIDDWRDWRDDATTYVIPDIRHNIV